MSATPHDTVTPPEGAGYVEDWLLSSGDGSHRIILGEWHAITDSDLKVATSCIQHRDGHIDDGTIEAPSIFFNTTANLNSDQARELAGLLLELAAQIDGWVTR